MTEAVNSFPQASAFWADGSANVGKPLMCTRPSDGSSRECKDLEEARRWFNLGHYIRREKLLNEHIQAWTEERQQNPDVISMAVLSVLRDSLYTVLRQREMVEGELAK